MQLVKQDVGVWVKASDELPDKEGFYIGRRAFDSETFAQRVTFTGSVFTNYDGYPVVEWLKPIKQVYILTEEELSNTLSKFFFEWYNSKGSNTEQAAKEFVKSITNSK